MNCCRVMKKTFLDSCSNIERAPLKGRSPPKRNIPYEPWMDSKLSLIISGDHMWKNAPENARHIARLIDSLFHLAKQKRQRDAAATVEL